MIDVFSELLKDNPRANSVSLKIFADALVTYHEASQNIQQNGAVCSHPRTGTPIENPYLKIRAQQGQILAKMEKIKGDRVQNLLGQ